MADALPNKRFLQKTSGSCFWLFKECHGFVSIPKYLCFHQNQPDLGRTHKKNINQIVLRNSQRKKSPYSELSWSVFSRIWIEYGERRSIYPYSAQMWENADQNNSECGHFLLSDLCYEVLTELLTELIIMLFKKLLKVQIQAFLLATLFSTQTQCCSTFSLINLHMLLRCCLLLQKTSFTLTESHFIFNIFVIMSRLSSIHVLFTWSSFHFQPHFHYNPSYNLIKTDTLICYTFFRISQTSFEESE